MGGGGGGPADIFDLFGMGMGRGAPRGPQRADDVVHRMKVGLEDLYKGTTRKLQMTRKIKCGKCSGTGSKSGQRHPCGTCQGSGMETRMHRIAPGMVQQVRQACTRCEGTGFAAPLSDRCDACMGKGLVPDKKVFEVNIEPGMKQGSKIVFRGEAGTEKPTVEPGDLIFVLEQREHETYKRLGCDLLIERHVGFVEALTGTHFELKHLDGRTLHVSSAGSVIKPDSWMCIKKEGMPIHGRPFEKGNLYVHFSVDFPDQVTEAQAVALRTAFGMPANGWAMNGNGTSPTPMTQDDEEDGPEEVNMTPVVDMEGEVKMRRNWEKSMAGSSAYDSDSDEDMPRGAQRVSCAQQ
jgi:DnaJ homolog subfamily A member 2